MIAGLPLIFSILICCLVATLGVIVCRIFFQQINVNLAVLSSIFNAIAIIILNVVYDKLAITLTNWENHRTDTEYEDALITKTFAFQFVNSYVSLFYIAYFKRWTVVFNNPSYTDHCKYGNNDCITELMVQLATILATNIFVGQAQEVGVPYIMSCFKSRSEKQAAVKLEDPNLSKEERKKRAKSIHLSQAEIQGSYDPWGGIFQEYNEMVIQYGYVTLFAAAFPLAPLLALLNNIVEIRSDGFKMLTEIQRPEYQGAQDIGTWYKILNIIGFIAVLTNCLIVSITSTALSENVFSMVNSQGPLMATILVSLVLEHVIIMLKFIISELIPDEPEWVRIALARQTYFKDQAFETEDDKEKDHFNNELETEGTKA